ncbi:MAG: DUF86 domain-containing protein [Anderseniella sp.]|nr:DUF86 domain-containing protein [Anderseniella sp.]
MKKDPAVYVQHIYDCILRIEAYVEDGREAFFRDHKTQDAVIRNLEVIGQAVKDLGTDRLSDEQPAIPWSQIAGARNVLAHQYLGVDLTLVWNIVEKDLPTLKAAIDETAKRLSIQLHGPDDRS